MSGSTAYPVAPLAPVASMCSAISGVTEPLAAPELASITNTGSSGIFRYSLPDGWATNGGPCLPGSHLMRSPECGGAGE